ncbi:MAG: anthranilate phosphoribosyltransferase [Bacteroidales bacterium]|jgi:anthranilate phosphoribosyltransferase|nr:anthranilate phosphoribosyltransferase [Bacteroidales bacterium]MCI1785915.1 anthranilate phosphoribosyltransferase [Bacteroidales bacterium]
MKKYLLRLLDNETLSSEETKEIFLNITKEKYPQAQIAALLTCLQMRGVSADELIGFRDALMETRIPVDFSPYKPIDIVGTGGDCKNTFNISTCACFVVAGAGYKVAKHGNYASTSVSGASTVMEYHGVRFTNNMDNLKRSMEECNIAYLHAQLFNPAMKFVGPTRKQLQFPTVFNLLGPLINPCRPAYQLLGVANLAQMRLYATVLSRLGIGFSVITSMDGYDEISLTGDFKIKTDNFEHVYSPEDLGFEKSRPEELYGGSTPEEASAVFDSVLDGTASASRTNTVIANAGFAIRTITPSKSIEDCISEARESLVSGKALGMFRKYVEINS